MSNNILVTGGAGYIGSQICKSLKNEGFNPIVFDNLIYGHKWAVKWGDFIKGDLLDRDSIFKVLEKCNFYAVIHLASYAYVSESIENPAKYYRNNIVGAINLLDAMLENNVKNIIFSSTCATYGAPDAIPIKENDLQKPINPYGSSKLAVEKIIKDYHRAYNFKYSILRYFNAAGADLDGEIGEYHTPETHLIPLVIRAAFDKKYTLKIYGNDYKTTDGTTIRDYIHVVDLANAHTLSLKKIKNTGNSFCLNLGANFGLSVMQIINHVELLTNKKVKYEVVSRRVGDPTILIADNNSAKEEIGWTPKYSNISQILNSAIEWYVKNY